MKGVKTAVALVLAAIYFAKRDSKNTLISETEILTEGEDENGKKQLFLLKQNVLSRETVVKPRRSWPSFTITFGQNRPPVPGPVSATATATSTSQPNGVAAGAVQEKIEHSVKAEISEKYSWLVESKTATPLLKHIALFLLILLLFIAGCVGLYRWVKQPHALTENVVLADSTQQHVAADSAWLNETASLEGLIGTIQHGAWVHVTRSINTVAFEDGVQITNDERRGLVKAIDTPHKDNVFIENNQTVRSYSVIEPLKDEEFGKKSPIAVEYFFYPNKTGRLRIMRRDGTYLYLVNYRVQ